MPKLYFYAPNYKLNAGNFKEFVSAGGALNPLPHSPPFQSNPLFLIFELPWSALELPVKKSNTLSSEINTPQTTPLERTKI